MSIIQTPKPVKLVIGIFMKDRNLLKPVAQDLTDSFGPIDLAGPWFLFDFTNYYESEMGAPLFRRVLSFKDLIPPYDLANIKLITHNLENKHLKNDKRMVNIDPGYMAHERFVLATAKNFAHRICIGNGIYADLTLIYTKEAFQTLPWTYPDYAHNNMRTFLTRVRNKYIADFKKIQPAQPNR